MAKKINWQEHSSQENQRFPHLGGWIAHSIKIVFTFTFVFISFYYFILPQVKANYFYTDTTCLIMDKKTENPAKIAHNPVFEPKFLAIYQVNGRTYASWSYDILNTFYTDPSAKIDVLNQFKIGQYYVCWYDPADPNKIILKKGWDFISTAFFLMTLIVALVACVSFYKWYARISKK